jgi:hypothetical protein
MSRFSATTELISPPPNLNVSFAEYIATSSSSPMGYHANSEWLTCPEKSRLRAKGIRFRGFQRADGQVDPESKLNALDYGLLLHTLLQIRVWYGHDVTLRVLEGWRDEVRGSYADVALMMATYEQTFPYQFEPLEFIGVECEVITDLKMADNDPRPCLRSVRYDAVVRARSADGSPPAVYSLERKTAARSGGFSSYYTQGMIQMMLWNSNEAIVAKHGPMRGVIYEQLIKTKMPTCDRKPEYFSPAQQRMAKQYMRYSQNGTVEFKALPDGTFPKMLHACWGKYAPCDYISWCHEGVSGDYVMKDGSPVTDF